MAGGSLADQLESGPLSVAETARLFTRLAPALDRAHAKGIIHRDLKPGNILFDDDDNPYISDFGIAKLTEASAAFTGSAIVGTPAYMSPEQARGEKDIDGRSDIYALGAIVFQMLTGRFPYEADTPMGIVVKHITEPTPHILDAKPDLPLECEDLIQKVLAKNRDERYPTASGMAAALATIAGRTYAHTAVLAMEAASGPETVAATRAALHAEDVQLETPPRAQPEAEPTPYAAPGAEEERAAREQAEAERMAARETAATTAAPTPAQSVTTRAHPAKRGRGCAAAVLGGALLALFAFAWYAFFTPSQTPPQARTATATARANAATQEAGKRHRPGPRPWRAPTSSARCRLGRTG
jgi:serine/threonine-protein kinase